MNTSDATEVVNPASPAKPVLDFLEQKAESGEIPAPQAHNALTALRALAAMLRSDEPTDPQYLLDHLHEMGRRFQNRHPDKKRDTVLTYMNRAKTGLDWFIAWTADPIAFRFPTTKERPRREPRAEAPRPSTQKATSSTEGLPPSSSGARRYAIPLGPGRQDLAVIFPEDEPLTVNDVFRVMWALLVHAKDFDPRHPQVLSIARHGGEQ